MNNLKSVVRRRNEQTIVAIDECEPLGKSCFTACAAWDAGACQKPICRARPSHSRQKEDRQEKAENDGAEIQSGENSTEPLRVGELKSRS